MNSLIQFFMAIRAVSKIQIKPKSKIQKNSPSIKIYKITIYLIRSKTTKTKYKKHINISNIIDLFIINIIDKVL